MQGKYLDQFDELYDDFHIVKLPLLEEEVRGTAALRGFSANLLTPYQARAPRAEDVQAELDALAARTAELTEKLAQLKAGSS